MSDFSVELAAERIQNHRTREYFSEVYQDYVAGSYRSATVMLWSVVVCDLLFKLEEMRDAYHDTTASSILRDLEGRRTGNLSSPEWESHLLDLVSSRTSLLEIGDCETLRNLHAHRHLSAHPVLDQSDTLYSPTREQVRAYMRAALESVLTKPSLLTRKALDAFTDDVCTKAPILPDEGSFCSYLEAKYFNHLTPVVLGQLFRGVWNITFHAPDTQGEENRRSLFRALCLLYEVAGDVCESAVHNEPSYFSEIGVSDTQLGLLSAFLSRHPQTWFVLTDQARAPIRAFLDRNADSYALAWYCDESVELHLQHLVERIREGTQTPSLATFPALHDVAAENGVADIVHQLGILYYGRSGNFNRADDVYSKAVRPFLSEYTLDSFRSLLSTIETNYQTYNRGLARRDHSEIAVAVRERFEHELTLDDYPNFHASLGG